MQAETSLPPKAAKEETFLAPLAPTPKPKTFVPPSGALSAPIAIVGEQPGKYEVFAGEPFVGPAGQNLDEVLSAASISRQECYFTNVIKDFDHPITAYIDITSRGDVKISALGSAYIRMLGQELAAFRGNLLVACGNIALYALCERLGITNWRGSVIESTLLPARKVLATFHPANWTREKLYIDPSAYYRKYLTIVDFKKARYESRVPMLVYEHRQRLIKPSFQDCLDFLSRCKAAAQEGGSITYDIETVPGTAELSCIGFAYSPTASICIPFVDAKGDYFTPEQEISLMRSISELLENRKVKKKGQNVIFDSHLLFRKYGIISRNLDDTMVAQKIIAPELPIGLDTITSLYTDIPYYKQDGKIWIKGDGTYEKGWIYNCNDTLVCEIAFPKQQAKLVVSGNQPTYQRQVALIEPLTFMMEHGIKVDIDGMSKRKSQNQVQIAKLSEECTELMGININLNSPQQLAEYFYVRKRIKPYLIKGQITTNINALRRLATQHELPEAAKILAIRKLTKQNNTFLSLDKVDSDHRIRCAYKPVGTKFGRISSTENIFGTGMNLQNVPMEVREFLVADEGYICYGLDYAQFENRIVAYVGKIQQMIQAFEQGLDTHRLTAALVKTKMTHSATRYEDITDAERQELGKRPNHAFNYGFGPQSFALLNEVDLSTARAVHKAYHSAYPDLRSGYWAFVEAQLRLDRTLTNLYDRKVTFLGYWDHKLLNEAYSCIPQGTCGDCLNERGILFTYYDTSLRDVVLMTQIHDSMDIQLPLTLPAAMHADRLLAIKRSMEAPLVARGRQFIPPVDLTIGLNLNKKKGIELKGDAFSNDPALLAASLQAAAKQLGVSFSSLCDEKESGGIKNDL